MRELSGSACGRHMRAGLLGATALALIGVCGAPALAQDANTNNNDAAATPADDQGADNVIIVTAQLREQNVQDIPLSITAISGDLLEARSQTNLAEVSQQTPNLLLQQNPSGSGNSITALRSNPASASISTTSISAPSPPRPSTWSTSTVSKSCAVRRARLRA